ncbi:hypothetical protein [Dyadobacter sp. 3J3]|uniref:hypothetical protein n=1 Tax=Dyadobacter sp. 3J3 TaxID=2606600 RepID=UPI0013567395|nr:hypothetical protein [Dyadobacter sp. 3J3]
MKKIFTNFRQPLNRNWENLNRTYLDFQDLEHFSEVMSILAAFKIVSVVSEYNPIVFLAVPFVFLVSKKLRDKISSNTKLSRFLEPLMVSWMFASMIFVSVFSFSKLLGLDSIFQSILSFLTLYIFISVVIYQKRGLNPIFFGKKEMNKIHG